ncbi:NHL domain-containing protein [Striga asiatica]|uniref:NHL domain-containing protein n=1 Tax=Striga asiatica TaxID=4170 RepID=A0A5A7Q9C5_STRAF|nr:NHL domain-containing protein [Striga asiatica]
MHQSPTRKDQNHPQETMANLAPTTGRRPKTTSGGGTTTTTSRCINYAKRTECRSSSSSSSCTASSTSASTCCGLSRLMRRFIQRRPTKLHPASRQSSFQCRYDPLSYSLNFDICGSGDFPDDDYYKYYAFSSRKTAENAQVFEYIPMAIQSDKGKKLIPSSRFVGYDDS